MPTQTIVYPLGSTWPSSESATLRRNSTTKMSSVSGKTASRPLQMSLTGLEALGGLINFFDITGYSWWWGNVTINQLTDNLTQNMLTVFRKIVIHQLSKFFLAFLRIFGKYVINKKKPNTLYDWNKPLISHILLHMEIKKRIFS